MQRKKLDVPVDPNEVKEYGEFKLGQVIYCRRYPDNIPSKGEITKIHLGESVGAYHTFICEVTGQHRKALFSETMIEPTKQIKESIDKAVAKARKAAEAKSKDK